jgi:hypothetical protein
MTRSAGVRGVSEQMMRDFGSEGVGEVEEGAGAAPAHLAIHFLHHSYVRALFRGAQHQKAAATLSVL